MITRDRWNLRTPEGRCKLCAQPAGPHAAGCGGELLDGLSITATYRVRGEGEDGEGLDDEGCYRMTFRGADGFSLGVAIGKAFGEGTLDPNGITEGPAYGIGAGPASLEHLNRLGTGDVSRAVAEARRLTEEFGARHRVLLHEYEDARVRHNNAIKASYTRGIENVQELETLNRTLALGGLSEGVRAELEGRLRILEAVSEPRLLAPFDEETWRGRFRQLEKEQAEALKTLAERLRSDQ